MEFWSAQRQSTAAIVQSMREQAGDAVRWYAAVRCPHVPASFVTALARALGDISVHEAFRALDHYEEFGE